MIDYHVHTRLCNHAEGSMEQYVKQAIRQGLKEICFLDHLILSGPGKKHSMTPKEVPSYFQAVQNLKYRYSNQILIRVGLEVDFQPERVDEICRIVDTFSFDMIGSSVHFVEGVNIASRREASKQLNLDWVFIAETYFKTLLSMLDHDYFDIICHLDVIKKTGRTIPESCKSIIDDIVLKIAEKQRVIEINSGGWSHPAKECYPSEALINKCYQHHIPVVPGSDAHRPEDTGKDLNRVKAIIASAGYVAVCGFYKRNRYSVPI